MEGHLICGDCGEVAQVGVEESSGGMQGSRIMQSVQSRLMDNPDSHGQFVPGERVKM